MLETPPKKIVPFIRQGQVHAAARIERQKLN